MLDAKPDLVVEGFPRELLHLQSTVAALFLDPRQGVMDYPWRAGLMARAHPAIALVVLRGGLRRKVGGKKDTSGS